MTNEKSKIKVEDEKDEIKVFSASSMLKSEPDADMEERLSPVVEEPTSPITNNSTNCTNFPGFYPFPFLYPYFMSAAAATAQSNPSSLLTIKPSNETQTNHLFGTVPMSPFSFPGIPFPSGMINQSYPSNFFNPFGIPTSSTPPSQNVNVSQGKSRPKKPHVKKPLNAFMIFMKEQRAHIIEDSTLKESSAINKFLGQKWKELSRTEQDRYYAMAKEERNRHLEMYPNWSARDNYGMKKKKQTTRIEKRTVHKAKPSTPHDNDPKKCRARYGLEGINQWCKHCRRKKKCTRFLEEDMSNHANNNPNHMMNNYHNPSLNTHGMGGNPSSVSSPRTNQSDDDDDDDDSMNEPDGDDILSRQVDNIGDDDDDDDEENEDDNDDDSDEENKQQHHHHQQQQTSSHIYKPIPSKIESHQQQLHLPPPAHLYQPSTLPAHFTPNFHY